MKKIRKILKLLPPAFMMRIWLKKRYAIEVPPAPGGSAGRAVFAVLPYAFTAALSVRVQSDCRLLKYFLPYGKMRKFVKLMYNMQVGDTAKDKGVSGFVRSVLPYGLVLWWDAEETRIHAPRKNTHGSLSRKGSAGDFSTGESFGVDHSDYADMDRIEALAMRSQMMLDSGMRLDTSRIGG